LPEFHGRPSGYGSGANAAEIVPSSVDLYGTPRLIGIPNLGNYSIPILDGNQPSLQATPSTDVFHLGGGTGYPTTAPPEYGMTSGAATAPDGLEGFPPNGTMAGYAAVSSVPGGEVFGAIVIGSYARPSL